MLEDCSVGCENRVKGCVFVQVDLSKDRRCLDQWQLLASENIHSLEAAVKEGATELQAAVQAPQFLLR